MTRYLLLFIISFYSITATAQIGVGTQTLGLNTGFTYNKSLISPAQSGSHSVYFQPNYGRFLSHNVYIGGAIAISKSENNISTPQSVQTFNILSANVVGRYYLNPSADWKFFGETTAGYRRGKGQNTIPSVYNNFIISSISASVTAGLDYFLSETFALEGRLTFIFSKYYSNNNFVEEGGGDRYLIIKPINFIQPNPRGKQKDFVNKGRMLVDGGVSLVSSYKDLLTEERKYQSGISVSISYFIVKGLMVGGYVAFDALNDYTLFTYTFAPHIGYFYPIKNKLYAHGRIEYGLYGDNATTGERLSTNFNSEVGLSYFLYQNAALQLKFMDVNKLVGKENRTIVANIGLLYFMK